MEAGEGQSAGVAEVPRHEEGDVSRSEGARKDVQYIDGSQREPHGKYPCVVPTASPSLYN